MNIKSGRKKANLDQSIVGAGDDDKASYAKKELGGRSIL